MPFKNINQAQNINYFLYKNFYTILLKGNNNFFLRLPCLTECSPGNNKIVLENYKAPICTGIAT